MSFLKDKSCQTSSLEQTGTQPPNSGGVDDLGSFQACMEEIKRHMSRENPSLYEVLGEIASSNQPIEEGDIFRASQNIMKEKQRALRVLQGEEEKQASQKKRLINKCLEAWRQLNLQCTTSKWSIYYQLLASIMNISFDTQPASCLQQFNAWKEQVVRYQQLAGEQLPDSIKLSAVVNGLKGSVRNFVLLNLHGDSSFGDLDSLLARYVDIDQHESSLARACTDKPESIGKGKGKEPIPSFKHHQLEQGGKDKEGSATCQEGKGKSKLHKDKGEANSPQPPAYKGKGKHAQLPTRKKWCRICWKQGHSTQACWWNIDSNSSSSNNSTNGIKLGTTQAISSNGRAAEATASGIQHRPAHSLHHLDSRQPTHVELRASISSLNPASLFSPSLHHSPSGQLSECFQHSET